jgi:TolB-like protein/Tfp pilus assembly protein PilF
VSELSPDTPPPDKTPVDRLDSWKEIAAYLKRDVTTAQRWEKREGMPVHRHLHDRLGSVYASKTELDVWVRSRKPRLEPEEQEQFPEAETPAATPALEQPIARSHVRHWWVLGVLVFLAVLALSYRLMPFRPKVATGAKITSLAVLPLKNLSGDPAQDYLADGMTEALIGRLADIRDLRVISRTSAMHFKDTQLSVPEIAKTLHVDAIVEGSVIRDGSRIRIHAQLIRASTDEHFWSESYDRDLRDVLDLQSDVAQAIARKVQVTVSGEERSRLTARRSVSPEAYESYLQGSFLLDRSIKKADIQQGIDHFEDAIKKDPTFAPAYLGVALGYSELGSNFIGDPPDAARQKAMSAVQKALELDPTLAGAHDVLADLLQEQWKWAEAEAEYRRALELNPNDASAHEGLASWFLSMGRTEEALDWVRRARELDPFEVRGTDMAIILSEARHYDEAIRELRALLVAQPDDPEALWDLGIVLVENNQPKEAIPILEKAVALSDRSPGVIGVLINAYARAGRRSDALRLLAELNRRRRAGYVPAKAFVNAYLGLGEEDQTFAWLEQAYKERSNILQFLKVDPNLDPLRSDPRFADLLRRVGLA